MNTNFSSEGCLEKSNEAIITFSPTDLPCLVAPATSKCGASAKSNTSTFCARVAYPMAIGSSASEELKSNNFKIKATLQTYKIEVREVKAVVGPTITLYKLYPAPGVTVASIMNKDKEIALALNSDRVRLVMLPDSIGIEVPNLKQSIVPLKAVLNNDEFRNSKAELPIPS